MYRVYVHYLEQPHDIYLRCYSQKCKYFEVKTTECRSAVGKRPFHTRFRVWAVVIVGEPIVTEM